MGKDNLAVEAKRNIEQIILSNDRLEHENGVLLEKLQKHTDMLTKKDREISDLKQKLEARDEMICKIEGENSVFRKRIKHDQEVISNMQIDLNNLRGGYPKEAQEEDIRHCYICNAVIPPGYTHLKAIVGMSIVDVHRSCHDRAKEVK